MRGFGIRVLHYRLIITREEDKWSGNLYSRLISMREQRWKRGVGNLLGSVGVFCKLWCSL